MKRLIWIAILVLLTMAGIALLYTFRVAVLMFFLSLVVAAFFRPLVAKLRSWRFPKVLAIVVSYTLGLTIIGGLIYLGGASLLNDLQAVADGFAADYTRFRAAAVNGSEMEQTIAAQLPPVEALYAAIAGEQGGALAQTVLGFASGVAGFASRMVIILVLSIYWSIDESHFERLWFSILPANVRVRVRDIWREIDNGVGAYLRSEIIQSLLAAVLLAFIYRMLGMPYPTLLAVIGALAWLIPWVGAVLAIVPLFLVGLSVGVGTAVAAAVATALVLGFLEVVVEPRLFNRKQYSSILIVLLVIAMADAYGLIGVLIAPPLAAAIQILGSNLLTQPSVKPVPEPAAQLELLRGRLLELRENEGDLGEHGPHVESWIERLDELLERTREEMEAAVVSSEQ